MDGEEVRLKPDALAHLADALMEDIVAAPPHQLAVEEIVDAGCSRDLVFRFDDILAEAAGSSTERPASRHGSAMWNLTDALCEDLAAQPDEALPDSAADDRCSLAAQFDDIAGCDLRLTRAGLTLPAKQHPALHAKAMLATLAAWLIAPLHNRAAAGAFATIVMAAILTAVVYQPSRWTVEYRPLHQMAGPESVSVTSPEPAVVARVESRFAPADGGNAGETGNAGEMAKSAEVVPQQPGTAAASEELAASAPPMYTAAAAPPPRAASAPVAASTAPAPAAVAPPPAAAFAPVPTRKQRAADTDAALGGRVETARTSSARGRLEGLPTRPALPGMSLQVPAAPPGTPGQLSAWLAPRQAGDFEAGLKALENAARDGDVAAAWKLGRIYADGDGVPQDHQRAFGYFSSITEAPATSGAVETGSVRARFVASAFVAVGHYYRTGIANSDIKPDRARARDMFAYAATAFGDPDAQYELGRMYLGGDGGSKDPLQGARWLYQAAMKGHYRAQAAFGSLLFKGDQRLPRDAAKGLMWLKLAAEAAPAGEKAIADLYNAASKQASRQEREAAEAYLKQMRQSREK